MELEKKILNGMYRDVRDTAIFYMSKCEKLEKTIEIIKIQISLENIKCENGNIYIVNIGDVSVLINEEEYNLLNEGLNNE